MDQLDALLYHVAEESTCRLHHNLPPLPIWTPPNGLSLRDWPTSVAQELCQWLEACHAKVEIHVIGLHKTLHLKQIHRFPGNVESPSYHLQRDRLTARSHALATDAVTAHHPLVLGIPGVEPACHRILQDHVADGAFTASIVLPLTLPNDSGHLVLQIDWIEVPPNASQVVGKLLEPSKLDSLRQHYRTWELMMAGERWFSWTQRLHQLWNHRLRIVVALLVACCALAIVPIPHRPTRPCVLQSTHRHFIAAPLEGRLLEAFVRPGESVHAGQLLAKMEDITLQRELSSAEAALESSSRKRDLALANQVPSDLRLAQLEVQQNQLKVASLRDRLQELAITSPIDGIILQGDWFGSNGRPVSFGQTLFEIGSLESMTAEIQLNSEDLPWVHIGGHSKLQSPAAGLSSYRGSISRIEPQATTIDDRAVFLAEMQIDDPDGQFRPGMKTTASVDGGWHSIAWILFRKPYRWFVNQWVW